MDSVNKEKLEKLLNNLSINPGDPFMKDVLHIGLGILSILVAWKWGDWRNWKKYYPTMMFMATGNLLYAYIAYKIPY